MTMTPTQTIAITAITAEAARTPHDPRLTAYEAGRWYALNDRILPSGATSECHRGYWAVIEGN